ncbi:MAG: IS630 family transposase [Erythrobacter sp.]|jgi:transposase|nr:IS630 family transposase [Erythrobacter sp.]
MKRLTKTATGRLKVRLGGRHRDQLLRAAKTHSKPQIRERAAAILKVAGGQSVEQVAESGLLVRRHRSTVYNWISEYFTHGLDIWQQTRQRHAKLSDPQQAELIKILTEKSPADFGSDMTRWTLGLLHEKVDFLSVYKSLSGIFYLLESLRLAWIRCRDVTESIDKSIDYKIRRNRRILGYVRKNPQKAVMLFLDEFSVYRQPLRGKAWAVKGTQPKNHRSRSSNTRQRIVGAINAQNGGLYYESAAKITVKRLCQFLESLRDQYPNVKIYLVLDNWHNVHRHPITIAKLQELGIIALWQPTYMPQSNPIERLWWHLSEQLLRIHRYSDDWQQLKQRVSDWLDPFLRPSQKLLEMVGLLSTPAIRTQP